MTEARKFGYQVGKIYAYDYSAETASLIGGTSDDESRLHLSARAEFEVVSSCEFILRVISPWFGPSPVSRSPFFYQKLNLT